MINFFRRRFCASRHRSRLGLLTNGIQLADYSKQLTGFKDWSARLGGSGNTPIFDKDETKMRRWVADMVAKLTQVDIAKPRGGFCFLLAITTALVVIDILRNRTASMGAVSPLRIA